MLNCIRLNVIRIVDLSVIFVSEHMNSSIQMNGSHPSFGTNQAWFQFGVVSNEGKIRKILYVHAKNPDAVACIEQLVSVNDNVSEYCTLLAVMRDCRDIGFRSDLVDECPFVDFILDMVDPDRVINDQFVGYLFSQSLSPEEREYALNKTNIKADLCFTETVDEYYDGVIPEQAVFLPALPSKRAQTVEQSDGREGLIQSALVNMGFQKSSIKKWINDTGNSIHSGTIPEQIKNAIRSLSV